MWGKKWQKLFRPTFFSLFVCIGYCLLMCNPYSMLSMIACQVAAMMFSPTPTVFHDRSPSLVSTWTRVLAAVAISPPRMRALKSIR